jgi:hypothetical protein
MFLNKIKSGESGILLYGITPPKEETIPERVAEIAEKTIARLIPWILMHLLCMMFRMNLPVLQRKDHFLF